MTAKWKEFLESRAAPIHDDGSGRFDRSAEPPECALFDLSHLGLIAVEGEDAVSFLQGQITQDATLVTAGRSLLAGHCSPKGRLLASFRMFRRDDAILLQLPAELLGDLLKRLRMYLLRSQAQLRDASEEWIRIGLAGDCAPALLAARLSAVPSAPSEVTRSETITCLRIPGSTPRFELIGPMDAIQPLWEALDGPATPSDSAHWALLDIRAGLPTVLPETVEAFVPQMTNLQLVDGVSFHKGCYTGQEVVARMQYLGKLKRRMYLAHADSPSSPRAGEELFAADSASGQGAGRVVDARPAPEGGYDMLAVVEILSAEANDVHLGGPEGPRLSFKPLPYGFDSP